MQNAFTLVVGVFSLSIAYVYPFVAVWRGSTVSSVVRNSWGMQMVYFISLCLVLPAIGAWFSPELGRVLDNWVPDTPILVPVLLLGWISPFLAGSIAIAVRNRARPKSLQDSEITSP